MVIFISFSQNLICFTDHYVDIFFKRSLKSTLCFDEKKILSLWPSIHGRTVQTVGESGAASDSRQSNTGVRSARVKKHEQGQRCYYSLCSKIVVLFTT